MLCLYAIFQLVAGSLKAKQLQASLWVEKQILETYAGFMVSKPFSLGHFLVIVDC